MKKVNLHSIIERHALYFEHSYHIYWNVIVYNKSHEKQEVNKHCTTSKEKINVLRIEISFILIIM